MANPRWVKVAATALVASLLVAGCDEKDSEKCGKGQQGVRESLKAGDSSLLKQHPARKYDVRHANIVQQSTYLLCPFPYPGPPSRPISQYTILK